MKEQLAPVPDDMKPIVGLAVVLRKEEQVSVAVHVPPALCGCGSPVSFCFFYLLFGNVSLCMVKWCPSCGMVMFHLHHSVMFCFVSLMLFG